MRNVSVVLQTLSLDRVLADKTNLLHEMPFSNKEWVVHISSFLSAHSQDPCWNFSPSFRYLSITFVPTGKDVESLALFDIWNYHDQVDEEPAIRTNTTILLGNIASYLNDAVSIYLGMEDSSLFWHELTLWPPKCRQERECLSMPSQLVLYVMDLHLQDQQVSFSVVYKYGCRIWLFSQLDSFISC